MILPIAPLSQRDPRWGFQQLGTVAGPTVATEGCDITCFCMMATYYGQPILPDEFNQIALQKGLFEKGDLFKFSAIDQMFPDIKYEKYARCQPWPVPIAEIKSYLDAGKPVIVALMNTGVVHFVLVVGYEGDQIYVNDPAMGDQVALNDRWGDPMTKILEVDYYTGPVPVLTQPAQPDASPATPSFPTEVSASNTTQPEVQNTPGNTINIQPDPISDTVQTGLDKLFQKIDQVSDQDRANVAKNRQQAASFIDSLKSRKFILSVGSALVALFTAKINIGLTTVQVWMIMLPLLAFVLTEGIADIIERAKK